MEIVLDGYWQNRPSEQMKAMILADWMDELEDWTVDQIRAALRQWRRAYPSKKPNAGHILELLKKSRGQAWVAQKSGWHPDPVFAISQQEAKLLGAA